MAKYKLKPMVIEALSFRELMDYGIKNTTDIHNNMPRSFNFMGCKFTRETDAQYFVSAKDSDASAYFTKNQMIVIENDRFYIVDIDVFNQTYELIID